MIELLGLLLPPLIDLANYLASRIQDKFISSQAQFYMSFFIATAMGLILNFLSHGNQFGDQNSIATSILSVIGASQISYRMIWKGTEAHKNLEKST